jgi:hypothetical protein
LVYVRSLAGNCFWNVVNKDLTGVIFRIVNIYVRKPAEWETSGQCWAQRSSPLIILTRSRRFMKNHDRNRSLMDK